MPFSRRRARFSVYHRSRFVCNSSVVLKMMESCNVRDVLGPIWLSENHSIPVVRMHLEKSKMVILLALPEGLVGKWLSSIKQILNPSRPTAVQRLKCSLAQNRIIQLFSVSVVRFSKPQESNSLVSPFTMPFVTPFLI